ncbi:MAG: prenyltransferase/squalene oxidase repeat-containing protein [Planctomycetota bacterium]|jgi:hypothetical protein
MTKPPLSREELFFDGIFTDFLKKLPPWAASLGLHGLLGLLLTLGSVSLIIYGGGDRYGPELRQHRSDGREEIDSEVSFDLRPRMERRLPPEGNFDRPPNEDYEPVEEPIEQIEREEEELPTELDSHDVAETPEPSNAPFQGKYWNAAIGIGGGAGGAFGGRFGGRRNLRAGGGNRHTESAVLMGLIWLKNHQDPDGMWSCKDFSSNCAQGCCAGAGSTGNYDVGCTGLALMAFLGGGHTHRRGKFKETVKRALGALKRVQSPDGCFGPKTPDGRWIYNHSLASLAMAEACGMTNSPLLRGPAQKGIDLIAQSQNPGAGWRYGSKTGKSDSSVTAWAVLALKSAKVSGLNVPRKAVMDALQWFDSVTDPTYGRVGYLSRGDSGSLAPGSLLPRPQETMTAAAILCRLFVMGKKARKDPVIRKGAALLTASPPAWDPIGGSIDMYYWFFGTKAMFDLGGPSWKDWNEGLKTALVPSQRREGCEIGSWDPVGPWGKAGGRVYATAINCLTLETYYRYSRLQSWGGN